MTSKHVPASLNGVPLIVMLIPPFESLYGAMFAVTTTSSNNRSLGFVTESALLTDWGKARQQVNDTNKNIKICFILFVFCSKGICRLSLLKGFIVSHLFQSRK